MLIVDSLHTICKLFHCSFRGLVYIIFSGILARLYFSKKYSMGSATVLVVLEHKAGAEPEQTWIEGDLK